MIRFRCQECGKKLKADESIIGRHVKCTRCKNVEVVPPQDRLEKPAPKPAPDIADSDDDLITADSADDFDFIGDSMSDFGGLDGVDEQDESRLATAKPAFSQKFLQPTKRDRQSDEIQEESVESNIDDLVKESSSEDRSGVELEINPKLKDLDEEPLIDLPEGREEETAEPARKFALKQPEKPNHTVRNIVLGGGVIAMIAAAWFVTPLVIQYMNRPAIYPPEFLKISEVNRYRMAIDEVEKARRVMRVMGEAFVLSNNASEIVMEDLNDFNASIEAYTKEETLLAEAYELYVNQQTAEAKKKLRAGTAKLKELKVEVEEMTSRYTGKSNETAESPRDN